MSEKTYLFCHLPTAEHQYAARCDSALIVVDLCMVCHTSRLPAFRRELQARGLVSPVNYDYFKQNGMSVPLGRRF